jgi:hypothetical protein
VRKGLTFVEIMVVSILMLIVLGSIMLVLQTGRRLPEQVVAHLDAQGELRRALARITQEVRESSAILFPVPGQRSQGALGLVNARSEVIIFRQESADATNGETPFQLVREKLGGSPEVVLRQVTRFAVTTQDPAQGADPLVVHLILSRRIGGPKAGDHAGVSLMTSVARRLNQSRCLALQVGGI